MCDQSDRARQRSVALGSVSRQQLLSFVLTGSFANRMLGIRRTGKTTTRSAHWEFFTELANGFDLADFVTEARGLTECAIVDNDRIFDVRERAGRKFW